MKQGDFTNLAKHYIHRVGYSDRVLRAIACYIGACRDSFIVADVGAGTGKLTENLLEIGMRGFAVEPNAAMRKTGAKLLKHHKTFEWRNGSAESTGLPTSSANWVLMGSSFHWTKSDMALKEFHRILKPGGFLTVLWNPRDLENSVLEQRIEDRIREIVPDIKRVSSGASKYTRNIEEILTKGGYFKDVIFIEAPHIVYMDKKRYIGVWKSVNDIQSQAGPGRFRKIIAAIKNEISGVDTVTVHYKTRAWTVQRED